MDSNKKRVIILKKTLFQESDLIIKGLTSDGEKIETMAKAALKSKKRFGGGVLEPINYVEMTLAPKKNENTSMQYLNEARLIYDFPLLRTDYDRIKMAVYFLKVITKIDLESDSSYVFDLLQHTLKALENSAHLGILKAQFEVKFLYKQGVLAIEEDLAPFLKTSLYDSATLKNHQQLESIFRRSSFEMENYFEQLLDLQ